MSYYSAASRPRQWRADIDYSAHAQVWERGLLNRLLISHPLEKSSSAKKTDTCSTSRTDSPEAMMGMRYMRRRGDTTVMATFFAIYPEYGIVGMTANA